jgi:Transposase
VLPNDKAKLRALVIELKAHDQLLLVVDQPATIGALPVAVARDEGVLVSYLPGLSMRRIADLHAGEGGSSIVCLGTMRVIGQTRARMYPNSTKWA